MTKQFITTKDMTLVGLMAALLCILGPWTIVLPVTPVPISFTSLGLYFILMVLGWKKGTLSYIVYLLLGFVGLPVFSGFTGGMQKLAGPTGGYLVGFLFMTIVSGRLIEKWNRNQGLSVVAMVMGTIITYGFGTMWLCYQLNLNFIGGLSIGVIPYLPGDTVKILVGVFVGNKVWKAVKNI